MGANAVTFGELRSQVTDLLNRSDCTPTLAEQFIRDSLNRCHRNLKVPGMERRRTLTPETDGTVLIPQDFIEIVDLTDSAGNEYRHVTADQLRAARRSGSLPLHVRLYTRLGRSWEVFPALTASETILLTYYSDPPVIQSDGDRIPIFFFAPELVKYGALIYACAYYDDDRQLRYAEMFKVIQAELEDQAASQEMSNANMTMHASYTDDDY